MIKLYPYSYKRLSETYQSQRRVLCQFRKPQPALVIKFTSIIAGCQSRHMNFSRWIEV